MHQTPGLPADSFDNLRVTVPEIVYGQPADKIKVAPAAVIPDINPFSPFN